jgi:hypothetical protein
MTMGATLRTHAAQVLVRLVVVMGLLIGVTGAMIMHCANEMGATPPASHSAGSNATSGYVAGHGATHHTTALAEPHHDPRGTGGMLITCLAFLIAVITAMSQLRPGQFRAVVGILRSTRAHVSDRVISRAPLLAELCVLRT